MTFLLTTTKHSIPKKLESKRLVLIWLLVLEKFFDRHTDNYEIWTLGRYRHVFLDVISHVITARHHSNIYNKRNSILNCYDLFFRHEHVIATDVILRALDCYDYDRNLISLESGKSSYLLWYYS